MISSLSAPTLSSTLLPSLAAIATLGLTVTTLAPASAATLTPVNTELSLLIDVSFSISNRDYALQVEGYQNAFTRLSSQFGSQFGSVAINLIQWAGANQQQQSIPWTLINDQTSALQFADTIGTLMRPRNFGNTAPGSAIQFATPLFSSNAYEGQRWVIDVSGDGTQNSGISTRVARDNALAAGVDAINGLPIVTIPSAGLEAWYQNNVQGGVGSFVIAANGFADIDRALEEKLRRELTLPVVEQPEVEEEPAAAVPEPTTLLGLAIAGGGLAWAKRRRAV